MDRLGVQTLEQERKGEGIVLDCLNQTFWPINADLIQQGLELSWIWRQSVLQYLRPSLEVENSFGDIEHVEGTYPPSSF